MARNSRMVTSDFWAEFNTAQDRKPTMIGATRPMKKCHCCGKYASPTGSKNVDIGTRNRAFVCAQCAEKGLHLGLRG